MVTVEQEEARLAQIRHPRPARSEDLTPRERQLLRLMADDLTNKEIAWALCIAHETVKSHATHIRGKLGVHTKAGAVAVAIRRGLV